MIIKKIIKHRSSLFILVILIGIVQFSSLQAQTVTEEPGNKTQIVKLSGEFGLYNEFNTISGRERRRPSSTQRLFFNPTISFSELFRLDFKFVLSSEGNSSRQDINQLDINPKWSWGNANAGDFSLSYTPLTVSGIKIRGGAFEITPGKFHLASFGGTSQREIITFDKQQSFKREIYGGLIGYGKSTNSHIQLTVLKAEDIFNTIEETTIDTTGMPDTLLAEPAVTPKENLVASLKSKLNLYKGKFVFNAEISGSAFTRDLTSSELNPGDVPSGVEDVFTLNTSSSFDYAYITDLKLKFHKISFDITQKHIGPGYVSLGLASLQNDVKSIGFGIKYRYKKIMFRVNTSFQSDNLIDQKLFTTNRNKYRVNLNYRISRKWNMNNSFNISTMKNDATADNLTLDYTSFVLHSGHRVALSKNRIRSLSFDYTYQKSKDANQLRTSSQLDSHSGSIGLQVMLTQNIQISPSFKLLLNKQGTNERKTTQTFSLTGRHYAVQKKLATSMNISLTNQDESDNFRGTMRTKYSFENVGVLGIELSYNKFNTTIVNSSSFNESFVKLTYSKSF